MNVLIVDDSHAMRMLIMRALRACKFEGLGTFEAGNGAEALDAFEHRFYDLVLTDLHMSQINGEELIRELKRRDTNVVCGVVTAETDPSIVAMVKDAGASFVLNKPFTGDELALAIRAARAW